MPLPPWRSPLARALHLNRSLAYARYLQLATIRTDGRPANRTIVFRGFLEHSHQLQFVTDARSEKADQISPSPHHSPTPTWGELCWYFPKTREQFRLLGTLTLVKANDSDQTRLQARQTLWQTLSDAARSQFAWPHPGQPRADAAAFAATDSDPVNPIEHFCLLLLDPTQVDHLQLKGEPQNRCLYYRVEPEGAAAEWVMRSVNP